MNHLQLVTDDTPAPAGSPASLEPDGLLFRPVWVFRRAAVSPSLFVKLGSRRRAGKRCKAPGPEVVPVRPVWRNPLRTRVVEGGGDLLAWRAPARVARPIRPSALRALTLDAEIALPRSRRRKRHAPRLTIAGDSHETLGNRRLTRAERAAFALDMEDLVGERFGPPKDDRECPLSTAAPCPRVGCRHHLYLEVDRDRTTLNWPGRHVDELEETCSVRAARAAAVRRQESGRPGDPAMSHAEVGRLLNLTAESVRGDLMRALAKLRAAGLKLGD